MSVFGSSRSPTQGGMMYQAGSNKGAIVIKARYGSDIRRIPIINEELTYDDLIIMMQRVFKLSERDAVLVKYTDDDGDMVTILDNGDLSHAKTYDTVLRLTLFVNGKGPTISSSAQLHAELMQLSKAVATLSSKLEQLEPEQEAPTAVQSDSGGGEGGRPEPAAAAQPAPPTPTPAPPTRKVGKVDFGKDLDPLAASPVKVEPSPVRPTKPAETPQSAPQLSGDRYAPPPEPHQTGANRGYDQQQQYANGHNYHNAPAQEPAQSFSQYNTQSHGYTHAVADQYAEAYEPAPPSDSGSNPGSNYYQPTQGHAQPHSEGHYDAYAHQHPHQPQPQHPPQHPHQQPHSSGSGQYSGYEAPEHNILEQYASVYEK